MHSTPPLGTKVENKKFTNRSSLNYTKLKALYQEKNRILWIIMGFWRLADELQVFVEHMAEAVFFGLEIVDIVLAGLGF